MSWARFFRRRFWDDERARELAAYLEQEIEDNIARGLSPEQARRAAHRKLGNPTLIREDIYTMNTMGLLDSAWRDFKFGARLLRRNPVFATIAVLTLALGTGANAAIFQLVDAVRLRTLPVDRPEQLVEIRIDSRGKGRTGSFISRRSTLTYRLWQRLQSHQEPFESLMAWSNASFNLAESGEARPIEGLWVSGTFFQTLGVPPAIGRVIGPADDTRGCSAPGVVLGHAFWKREYGGDTGALGRTILLDGHRFDIIGVAPQRFFGVEVGRSFDVALPLCSEPIFRPARSALERSSTWFLGAIGRLKPGWTAERATAHLRTLSPVIFKDTLPEDYVKADSDAYLAFLFETAEVGTGFSPLRNTYSTPLWVLLGVTALVLVITCANLANLMLARSTARQREIGIRLAIGASRGRIARQLLSESLLIAGAGAIAGLVLARWLSRVLVSFLDTSRNAVFLDLAFDWRIFAFTAAIGIASCLAFGLAPALRATGSAALGTTLGTRGASEGRERFTLRRGLVVLQVALSLVLVVGALLFGRSFQNLLTLDPGFREENVLLASLDLRRASVPPENRRTVFDSIIARLRAVPGVINAAEVFIAPISGSGWNNRIVIDGKVQTTVVNFNSIGPGFLQTMGTRLVAGRDFTEHDTLASTPVAIVNELFAKQLFPGVNPIGRTFHTEDTPGQSKPRYQIVGIIVDTKYDSLRGDLTPIAYLAAPQERELDPFVQIALHTGIDPSSVSPAVTQTLREIHPAISVQFRTMAALVHGALMRERLMAALSGFFGALAIVIATTGLYGVMSYMVARRRMEIGIRMALGADRGTVVRMVVREAGVLLVIGIVAGAALSVTAAKAIGALLFGLQPWDPATLAFAIGVLGTVALLASWLPAYRAARLPPTIALREQP